MPRSDWANIQYCADATKRMTKPPPASGDRAPTSVEDEGEVETTLEDASGLRLGGSLARLSTTREERVVGQRAVPGHLVLASTSSLTLAVGAFAFGDLRKGCHGGAQAFSREFRVCQGRG